MKTVAIVIENNSISENGFSKLIKSSERIKNEFSISRFKAVEPDGLRDKMIFCGISWRYPWEGQVLDIETGLLKTAYETGDRQAKIACAVSHYELWKMCAQDNEPYLILEHDAEFIQKIDFDPSETSLNIIGINNPFKATRKATLFYEQVNKNPNQFQIAPTIDDIRVPQGIAGNSAYIIKPEGANTLIDLVKKHGLWPNDAIMCKQLVPKLGVTRKFYTKVQGLPSTTVL